MFDDVSPRTPRIVKIVGPGTRLVRSRFAFLVGDPRFAPRGALILLPCRVLMATVRLESLSLTGFKSFPDEVQITFPGQVSAIIGPNGCGKSNLVDAILWVLGEQSPSLMRLKNMGDVVFSGAAGRPAAGAAEVVIRLRSSAGHWTDTDGRLEIRRRVFTSGPSEYRLNGRSARLRDVVDELHAVGLGTRGYAIIEQGRVGQVLSARPTDRRVLIEEAAGITRYKARRHEAELKLERTRQNLLRLDDVIGEVTRSLRLLRRQAKQAERYEELRGELRDTVTRLLTIEVHRVQDARSETARRRGIAQNEVAAAAAALGGAEADLGRARRELETARQETETARGEVARLVTSQERLEAFLERSADLLDNLRDSLERTGRESARLGGSRSELEDRLGEAAARREVCRRELAEVRQLEADVRARATARGDELRAAEEAAAGQRKDLLRTISSLTESRNRLSDLDRERDRLSYVAGQLGHEEERLQGRAVEAAARVEETTAVSRAAAAAAGELERQRRELADRRGASQHDADAARREAEAAGHEAWELRHRLAGIERELASSTAAADELAGLLGEDAILGQVSDVLQPPTELAPLLDRLWADWLELPRLAAADLPAADCRRLADLEQRIRLVLTGQVTGDDPPGCPPEAEDLLAGAGAAEDDLPWLRRTLPPTWRTADADLARRLADAHPEALVVDPDGLVRRGRTVEPPTAAAQRRGALALRGEHAQLDQALRQATAGADAARARQQQLAATTAELAEALVALDRRLVTGEQERAAAAAQEQAATAELARLQRELDALRGDRERHRVLGEELEARGRRLDQEVATLAGRGEALERALEEATGRLEERRVAAADAAQELERVLGGRRLAEERAAAAAAEVARIEEERDRLAARLETLAGETRNLQGELERTESEVVRSRTRLAEEQGLLASGRERERQLAERTENLKGTVERLEGEVAKRRELHERNRDALHEIEVEATRLAAEMERLRDAAAAELDCSPEELLRREPPTGEAVEQLRAAAEAARSRLEAIGPVNLLAMREAAELEERAQFLGEQRRDLVASLESLDATIREIDATCSERFVATFVEVNRVLGETFTFLFGGGSARLELVDEDDPLESGVDITAQPPGKRNQSVQLLSGGEKALTALSLLISLFRIKPSPFCVLDEVDAPLDDANVERLGDLVEAMTEHTQFLLITHNRRTMARADALYGVTMEEPGVSKLVTVRLEE